MLSRATHVRTPRTTPLPKPGARHNRSTQITVVNVGLRAVPSAGVGFFGSLRGRRVTTLEPRTSAARSRGPGRAFREDGERLQKVHPPWLLSLGTEGLGHRQLSLATA
jgi:hypothetical protein